MLFRNLPNPVQEFPDGVRVREWSRLPVLGYSLDSDLARQFVLAFTSADLNVISLNVFPLQCNNFSGSHACQRSEFKCIDGYILRMLFVVELELPVKGGNKTVSFDQFLVPLLAKFLVLDNDGMKIALEEK